MDYAATASQTSYTPIATGLLPNAPHIFPQSVKKYVYVIDSDAGIADTLSRNGYEVISLASPRELSFQLQSNAALCLVLNLDSPELNANELLDNLRKIAIGLQVIAVTSDSTPTTAREALRGGASDLCVGPVSAEKLSECADQALIRDQQGEPSPMEVRTRLATLTEREREVVEHCLQGTITKVIAKYLDVTYQTIDKHRKKALRKMGAGSMVELSNLLNRTTLYSLGCNYEFKA